MGSSYTGTSSEQNHVKTHFEWNDFDCNESTLERYFCTKCNFSTDLKASLLEHLKKYHRLKKENEETDLTVKMYTCRECPFWTYSCLVLLEHQKSFHRESLENEDRVVEDYIKWYICHHCKYITKLKNDLKGHILDKHTLKLNRCNEYNYKAETKSDLVAHIRELQTTSEPYKWYKCKQCEYKDGSLMSLESHFYRIHVKTHRDQCVNLNLAEKPTYTVNFELNCDQCEYKTIYAGKLKWHKISKHKTNDPVALECTFCDYKTVYSANLKAHILNKHTSLEYIDWLKCDQCEYKAKTSSVMSNHKSRKHAQLNCDRCEYTTFAAADLKKHVLDEHDSEENVDWFGCDQCSFTSKTERNLAIHRVVHKDVKKFLCDECGYECKGKSLLKRHKMRKHESGS